jgi:hypothetical protein
LTILLKYIARQFCKIGIETYYLIRAVIELLILPFRK